MRDRPSGPTLLRLARAALLDELLAVLPRDRRYQARLIANAMAIAAREQDGGDAPLRAEYQALAGLFSEPETLPNSQTEGLEEAVQRLNWRLAAEVRGGRCDAAPEIYALLRAATMARLREVNPKALEEEEPN